MTPVPTPLIPTPFPTPNPLATSVIDFNFLTTGDLAGQIVGGYHHINSTTGFFDILIGVTFVIIIVAGIWSINKHLQTMDK